MKMVLLSDAHITSGQPAGRTSEALGTCIEKLLNVLSVCVTNKAPLLQAGDLFQKDRDWDALLMVVGVLQPLGVKILTVPGQHDKYYRTKNKATNLGILENAGLVHILGKQPYEVGPCYFMGLLEKRIVKVYGAGWDEPIPVPERDMRHTYNVLVIHAPISTKELYPEHQYQDARDVLRMAKQYDLILCGDTHRFFNIPVKVKRGTRYILNTGPMFRREANEYNMQHKPGYFLWSDGAVKWHEIPHEAADVALSRAHLARSTSRRTSLAEFTDKIRNRSVQPVATLRERVIHKIKTTRPRPEVAKLLKEVMDGTAKP